MTSDHAVDRSTGGPPAVAGASRPNAANDAPDHSAGVPPAVAGASRPRFGQVIIHDRGYLPHWESESATYFVTFRLAGSLPKSVLEKIESERRNLQLTAIQHKREPTRDEKRCLQKLFSKTIQEYLDTGAGPCHLKTPEVANAVAETLRYFDDKRYRLFAWCVMPNHVHVVVRLFPSEKLANVLHSWKSFSAKRANEILHSAGPFWQKEYYDHLIRNESELDRAIEYVAENPAKAGLGNWTWVWVWGQDAPTTAGGTPALRSEMPK